MQTLKSSLATRAGRNAFAGQSRVAGPVVRSKNGP
jgi:hypothetical protein